jgi:hypothetical protein
MEKRDKELQRLISLTFDESPAVRKAAAMSLSSSVDPAATFALIELSFDKDAGVKSAVQDILTKRRASETDKDAISFSDIFSRGAQEEEAPAPQPDAALDARRKMLLSPIEKSFERSLGKERAEKVKGTMMPAFEKILMKVASFGRRGKAEDSLKTEKALQTMITSYADALSPEEENGNGAKQAPEAAQVDAVQGLEQVGSGQDSSKIGTDLSAIVESDIGDEVPGEAEAREEGEKTIFHKAYDIMMASDGDEDIMQQQIVKMQKQLQEEVALAFRLAQQKFKSENITRLAEMRDGMRNVSTDVLTVKSAESGEYQRTKTKRDMYTRIVASDSDGAEGVIYLFDGRGKEVRPGMKIKIWKGMVKTFQFSKETSMTIGKRGAVYIVL